MKENKEELKRKQKTELILYSILWLVFITVVSAIVYRDKKYGDGDIFTAIRDIQHLRIFYWLNPITWWSCIKWSIVYWVGIAMFKIYEEKFKHDAAGIEAGSAHWNSDVEEYNEGHSEPFDEKFFSDKPNRPHGATDDSWMEGKKNNNNPKKRKDGHFVPPVPGNPNMIESETVRLSTADMKTHLNNNVFIVGGAGTGKSRFFIKPNILQMNCSYIVTDPSGELLKSMHNVLAENGYNIKVFNLVDMTHSCKYNPFKYVRTETDVSILVDCFISNTTAPDQKSGDPFWDKSEKALLSALIFYLVDVADPEFKKFSTILWMVQQAQMDESGNGGNSKYGVDRKSVFEFSLDTPLDELFNGTRKIATKMVTDKNGKQQIVLDALKVEDEKEIELLQSRIETSLCLTNYKTFKLGGTKTLKSILISAAVRLNPFSIPAIQNLTNDDNVELGEVGDKLTCFFAIIPQTNSTFNFLISMLFSQMFESLYYKGSTIPDSRLNYHVRFLLDEFANIGKIPEFPQKISTCRKYNISTTIVLQSIAQIKMLYKDDYETISGNCDTAICLGTNEQTTADYFSKKLGKATITSKSKSTQVGKSGGSMSFNQTGRELMTPDEIMTMKFNECIVMMNHISPFYDNKYPLEKHPQFEYTGDADESNFYYLENDPDFIVADNTREYTNEVIENNLSVKSQNEKYDFKPMNEVLKDADLLTNNPDEDKYILIKDVNKSLSDSMIQQEYKKMIDKIEKCKSQNYKTVYFDAEYIDPIIINPLIFRIMKNDEKITNIIVSYYDITGKYKKIKVYLKDENSNAKKIMEKLGLKYQKQEGQSIIFFNIEETIDVDVLNEIKNACIKGYEVISTVNNTEDESPLGYDDIF